MKERLATYQMGGKSGLITACREVVARNRLELSPDGPRQLFLRRQTAAKRGYIKKAANSLLNDHEEKVLRLFVVAMYQRRNSLDKNKLVELVGRWKQKPQSWFGKASDSWYRRWKLANSDLFKTKKKQGMSKAWAKF